VFYASHPDLGNKVWWAQEPKRPELPPVPPRYLTEYPFLNLLRSSLDAVAEFRAKGRAGREGWNLITGVPLVMAHAVRVAETADGARAEFERQSGVTALERLAELVDLMFLRPRAPKLCPFGSPPGLCNVIDATHIAWFLGRFDLAEVFARIGEDDRLADKFQHTAPWRDYARGNWLVQSRRAHLRILPSSAPRSRRWMYAHYEVQFVGFSGSSGPWGSLGLNPAAQRRAVPHPLPGLRARQCHPQPARQRRADPHSSVPIGEHRWPNPFQWLLRALCDSAVNPDFFVPSWFISPLHRTRAQIG